MIITPGRVALLVTVLVVLAFSMSARDQVGNAILFAAFAVLSLTLVWRFGRNLRS